MPVLLKNEDTTIYPTTDVEALVNEVRERLCLKSREKLCSHQRSAGAPYRIGRHLSAFETRKHYSSPELCVYRCKQKQKNSFISCKKNLSSSLRDNQTFEDPRDLLEKLISEQSLIQEAVRRLQTQTSTTPVTRKFFPLVDDGESCEQFTNKASLYSESEDERLSAFI